MRTAVSYINGSIIIFLIECPSREKEEMRKILIFLSEFKGFKSNGKLLINSGQVECCMISSHVSGEKYHPEGKILTEIKVKTSSSEIFF